MAEGQTATNPQTGERVVLRGGQWVPLGAPSNPAVAAMPSRQAPRAPRYNGPMPTNADQVFGSLIAQESRGQAGVRGPDTPYGNALGRTQVLPSTAKGIARNLGVPYREDLLTGTTPEAAAYQDQLGRAYLQEGFQNTGNARDALMYYHGGPDRALWGPKTKAYADEVLARWARGEGVAPMDAVDQPLPMEQGQTATNPQTGERLVLAGGEWVTEQEAIKRGVALRRLERRGEVPSLGRTFDQPWLQNRITRYHEPTLSPEGEIILDTPGLIQRSDGTAEIYDPQTSAYYEASPRDVERYLANQRQSQSDRAARLVRSEDPQYQQALMEARAGSEAVPERLRALTQGGALGFLDEIVGGAAYVDQALQNAANRARGRDVDYSAGLAAQAARDAEREAQARYAAENPLENFGLQFAGGLLTPGVLQAGRYVEAGTGAQRLARAGGVGAGLGAASGIGYGEGNLLERADDALAGAVVGSGAGVVGQAGVDRLMRSAPAAGVPARSAARRLSRAGVDLTPGQMAAEVPVVGPTLRYAEDILAGYNPLMTGVRRRQNEDVVRVAGQEALDAIGETLPRNARTGREVYNAARDTLSRRYDEVTDRVAAVLDDEFDLMLDNLRRDASRNLDSEHAARFNRIMDENVLSEVTPEGELSGDAFKRIETTLRQQSERARRPGGTLQDDDYADALDGARNAFRDVIARQFPDEAEAIRGLNLGWAINARIRRAVSGSAGFGRDGTPTPGELSQTVRQLSSEEQIAQDRGLLQGLAQDARTVLPATVGDTGSGQRAVIGGAIGALGTGAVATVNPALAGMIATGAVVYSRPGIAALNLLYRATDSRAASEIVQGLARQARSNPALLPYYEAALQHLDGLVRTDTPAAPPAPQSAPAPSAALQRVMQ